MNRVLLIVIDSVGIGEADDASEYGDVGSDTLGHIADKFKEENLPFSLPNLANWGLSKLKPQIFEGEISSPIASYGLCKPKSLGKDTTVGHWEMTGIILEEPFSTYPQGFPPSILSELERETGVKYIGNCVSSGTVIIEKLGEQHMKERAPILYTSADSVLQIAAHEDIFPIEKLYEFCKKARKICDKFNISRVIARPFIGEPGSFSRTTRRHDYSIEPVGPTILNAISNGSLPVVGVGKIKDIFNGSGVGESHPTTGNKNGIEVTLKLWEEFEKGLLFVNLVDFDMLYGHRNNWKGYGDSLMEFDKMIPQIEKISGEGDLVIITADHGNDPTFPGTDHNRENIPILVYKPGTKGFNLGSRETFADIGATIARHLNIEWKTPGIPFL
jgi:phosphopentomutase